MATAKFWNKPESPQPKEQLSDQTPGGGGGGGGCGGGGGGCG